jgi:hypothetical protein
MMMSLPRHLLICTQLLLATLGMGQSEDKLADLAAAKPGRDRSNQLVELSIKERERGHYKVAIEYAMLSAAEAERNGLDKELARSLMELAKAHRAKGDCFNWRSSTTRPDTRKKHWSISPKQRRPRPPRAWTAHGTCGPRHGPKAWS